MASDNMNLGLLELSAVREMANIGLGHATKSLTELTGSNFNMGVPYAESVSLTSIPRLLGHGEEVIAGIYMPVGGDIEGHMGFLFPWCAAQGLWRMLLGCAPDTPDEIGELESSTLMEVGNIITGSFLNAISTMTGYTLEVMPPAMALDMSCVVLESIVSVASQGDTVALAIETEIYSEDESTGGLFLYIPTRSGLRSLFAALGVPEAA